MARLRDSWPTSLPVAQQPRNPQPESIARNRYETGARYASDAWDSRPDVGVYVARAAGQDPHVTLPVLALIAAGAVGFLAAYLIQNSGFQRHQAPTREHGRGRNRRHRRNHT